MENDTRTLNATEAALFAALASDLLAHAPPGKPLRAEHLPGLFRAEFKAAGLMLYALSLALGAGMDPAEVAFVMAWWATRLEMMGAVGA